MATAAADAAAASILFPCTAGKTAAVVGAAALLYAGGAALNDAADADRDRALHPDRPVPSGAVTRGAASAFGAILLAAGVAASCAAGTGALLAYAGVAGAVLAYDLALKRLGLLGALGMGLCRGGSVFAAALSSPTYAGQVQGAPGRALLLPLPWVLHGFAVTAASLLEESPRRGALLPAAAAGVLLPAALAFPLLGAGDDGGTGFAIAAAALLTFDLGFSLARARAQAGPAAAGGVVRAGVFGFLLLDAVVLGVRGEPWPAAAAVGAWILLRAALQRQRS